MSAPLKRVTSLLQRLAKPGEFARVAHNAAGALRARVVFRHCEYGTRAFAGGPIRVVAEGSIRLANRVFFLEGMLPSELIAHKGGELVIGDDTGFNYGCSIEAKESVRIGHHCMFATMVRVRDVSHNRVAPVVIGNDVWIAHGVSIEPGVHIGDGAVISAGSVVVNDVPARSIAIGNPARCMPLESLKAKGGT